MFSRPSILLFENVPRRFGHAATDRQASYMTEDEIRFSADRDPLRGQCNFLSFNLILCFYKVI